MRLAALFLITVLAGQVRLSAAPVASSQIQDRQTFAGRIAVLVDEIRASSFPELRGADIRVRIFESDSDYFRARFSLLQFLTGRRMRYIISANRNAFERQATEASVRAIIAHELSHILYFKQSSRVGLFGLVRLASKGFTARFERWADLVAIARGYGEGLKEYRRWLYKNIPARNLKEKKRDYFSPEEIDAILSEEQKRPGRIAYWLKHVPRNLCEILAGKASY